MAATLKTVGKDGAVKNVDVKPGLKVAVKPGDVVSLAGASITGAQVSGEDFVVVLSDGNSFTLVGFIGLLANDDPPKFNDAAGKTIASLLDALNLIATTGGADQTEDDIQDAPSEFRNDPFLVDPPPQGPLQQDFPFDEFPTLEPLPAILAGDESGPVNRPPNAEDDMDMVMEGAATFGNVITGDDPDNEPSMLQEDSDPDGDPLIIRCIEHEGVVYVLSSDGTAVEIESGSPPGDWSYDDETGILTITSVKGGTLEINLDGPADPGQGSETISLESLPGLGEIGDYKYTAPDSVRHLSIEDGIRMDDPIQGTNLSANEIVALFDEVTLQACNEFGGPGEFGKKNVSFTFNGVEYNYAGIGVRGGGDNGETDYRPGGFQYEDIVRDDEQTFIDDEEPSGRQEAVKICYDAPETEAYIGLGALFDGTVEGAPYDIGYLEQVQWQAFLNGELVGSGTVDGTATGLVSLEIGIEGGFDKIELTPLDNGAGDNGNNSDFLLMYVHGEHTSSMDELFGYKIEDPSGATDTAVLKIAVKDDVPVAEDDKDMVLEGGMTLGNVVTGEDPDTDPVNQGMQQADDYGQDAEGGHIHQVEHNGITYGMANADDNGDVTIETELGGTLVINLLTGDYKYTAPDSLDHHEICLDLTSSKILATEGVTFSALNIDGSDGDLTFSGTWGMGVRNTSDGGEESPADHGNSAVPGQLNHAPDFDDSGSVPANWVDDAGASEAIVIDLENGASGFSFEYTRAIRGEGGGGAQGGEIGRWMAFDDDGNLVATGLFGQPETATNGQGVGNVTIGPGELNHTTVAQVVFTALPYAAGDTRENDSSDYYLREFKVQPAHAEEFDYVLVDGDWDTDAATLTIKVKDTAPEALDDKDMTLEGGMTEGNVISGIDPDTDPVNIGMLQADTQSQDQPHTIMKVEHEGTSYDVPETGYVDIPTALGGNLRFWSNGDYKYTAPDSVDHSPFHVDGDNIPSFVTVSALDKNGDPATVLNTSNGFGIDSPNDGGAGGRFDEINLVDGKGSDNKSETLVFKLDDCMTVEHAKVELSAFFRWESGVGREKGSWEAYKHGVLVGSDDFGASSHSGDKTVEIWVDGGFDEIRFTADKGSWDYDGGDSSDYYVEAIWFGQPSIHEEFEYTLADGDWSMDTATLKIKVKDTGPDAHDDMDMTQEGGMTEGNVVTGVDPDDVDPDVVEHNQGDLVADDFGQDEPHVVCEVTHDGVTYEIPEDGYVDIPTELGGTMRFFSNGDYKYTAPDALHHGPFKVNGTGLPSFVTVSGYGKNGQAATVTDTANGYGVDSNNDGGVGGRFDEINYVDNRYSRNDGSETLRYELADGMSVTDATVSVSALFQNEAGVGNERGHWSVYNDGVFVGSGNFEASDSSGDHMFLIDGVGSFDEIRFKALKGSADADRGDSSDYYVESIEFGTPDMYLEDFTYKLKDSDGSYDTADLTIKVKDTAPDALDDKDCVVEGGMTEGNVITGVDPDTNPNMLVEDDLNPDQPHGITQVEHNGQAYGVGEEFETELGGTFVINEDGSYKYTAPDSVVHKTTKLKIIFDGESAGFSNSVGYYIKDENGEPTFGQIVFADSDAATQGDMFMTQLDGVSDRDIGFFLIPDGADFNETVPGFENGADVTFQLIDGEWVPFIGGVPLDGKNAAAFFSDDGLNPDGVTHVEFGPDGLVGFEDLFGGGDNDFNDTFVIDMSESERMEHEEEFVYTLTDSDGSTDTANLNIKVKDGVPVANDDKDCVVEGTSTEGNVITGVDPDTSPNMLVADDPGPDGDLHIMSVEHNGNSYGAGEEFTTELGGTFVLNEDGSYTYTPPASVDHIELNAGIAFDDPQQGKNLSTADWLQSFTDAGVTLKALDINGDESTFGKKNVSATAEGLPFDYAGFGVQGPGDRGNETDFVEAGEKAEKIVAEFGTPLTGAYIGLAALFDGSNPASPFDKPFKEQVSWEAYDGNTLIASGVIDGSVNGLVMAEIDTGGVAFDALHLTPLQDSPGVNAGGNETDFLLQYIHGAHQDVVSEEFTYTVADRDWSMDTATLTIDVKDTEPVAEDDYNSVEEGSDDAVMGNVLDNDDLGQDTDGAVIFKVQHNGVTYTLANTEPDGTIEFQTELGGTFVIDPVTGKYSYTPPQSLDHHEFHIAVDGNDIQKPDFVTISALNADGTDGDVALVTNQPINGLGVQGGGDTEIDYVGGDIDGSETLIFSLDDGIMVQDAKVNLTKLFLNEAGGERGMWEAYNDGALVGSDTFDAADNDGTLMLNINVAGGFDELRFTAIEDGNGGPASDYSVLDIWFGRPMISESFDYMVADGDWDTDGATLTIKVTDDMPEVVEGDCVHVYEAGLPWGTDAGGDDSPVMATGELGIQSLGEDGFGKFEFKIDALLNQLEPHTSMDQPLTYQQTMTETGAKLVAFAGNWKIFELEANAVENTFKFTLTDPVDNEQDWDGPGLPEQFDFGFVVSDGDWSMKMGSFSVKVHDDAPIGKDDMDMALEGGVTEGNVITGEELDEPTLGNGDPNPSYSGDMLQADMVGADNMFPSITHIEHGDSGPIALGDDGTATITTDLGGTLVINSDGTYKYTAPNDLDHTPCFGFVEPGSGLGENASTSDWLNAFAGPANSAFPMTIKGFDENGVETGLVFKQSGNGDPAHGGLGVNGNPAGPETGVTPAAGDEHIELDFGSAMLTSATVGVGSFFNGETPGADGGNTETIGWEIFQDGVSVGSGSIDGTKSGLADIAISGGPDVTFDKIVLTPIDNDAGNNGFNSDFLIRYVKPEGMALEEFTYTLEDGDGSHTTADLTIKVKDDMPEVVEGDCVHVYEDGLPWGTDPDPADVMAMGKLGITSLGQDGLGSFQFDVAALEGQGHTSMGAALTYIVSDDGLTLTARAGNWQIFQLTADPENDKFTFNLQDPVDNEQDWDGPGLPEKFEFGFTVTDGDGSAKDGSFSVKVHDDAPIGKDDVDMTVEGGMTLGNVITGDDPDTDPVNIGMLHEDMVGADNMHPAVTHVEHNGTVYEVVAGERTTIKTELGGELVIISNGSYKYTAPDSLDHSNGDVCVTVGDDDQIDKPSFVTVEAFDKDGNAATLFLDDEVGIGVVSSTDGGNGGRFDELNHIAGTEAGDDIVSESLVFKLDGGHTAMEATVDFLRMYGSEGQVGAEQGHWEAFLDGVKVGEDSFAALNGQSFGNGDPGSWQITIDGIGAFDELHFTALEGSLNNSGDSSDYYVKKVNFGETMIFEEFTYTLEDGDGSHTTADLSIKVKDTGPTALDDKDMVLEGGMTSGNVIDGIDLDPETVGAPPAPNPSFSDMLQADIPGQDSPIKILSVNGLTDDDNDGSITVDTDLGLLVVDTATGAYKYTSETSEDHDPLCLDLTDSGVTGTAGVSIEAFNIDGSAGTPTFDGTWGMGVKNVDGQFNPANNGNGAVPNQLNHAPGYDDGEGDPGSSESIVITLDEENGACGFSFEYTRAIQGEAGGEVGRWTAFDADGNEIGTGLFGNPHTVTQGVGVGSVNVGSADLGGMTVHEVVFTALPYANGSSSSDSSDYFLREFKAEPAIHDVFTYTVVDTDGSTDSAELSIKIKDDAAPIANDDMHAVQAGMIAFGDHAAMDAPIINGNVIDGGDHGNGTMDVADVDPNGDDILQVVFADNQAGTDPEGDMVSPIGAATEVTGLHGTLTINPDGSYSYDLNDTDPAVVALSVGEFAEDTFTYKITDGDKTDTATLKITIEGNNDGPTAKADTNAVQESCGMPNGEFFVTIVDGSVGAENNVVPVYLTDVPNAGDFVEVPPRSLTSDQITPLGRLPDGDMIFRINNGQDNAVSWTLDGPGGAPDFGPFTIAANSAIIVNLGNVANGLGYKLTGVGAPGKTGTTGDQALTIDGADPASTMGNVLQDVNHDLLGMSFDDVADMDPDGDPLSVSAIEGVGVGTVGGDTAGAHGTLTLNADGSYTYVLDETDPDVNELADPSQTLTDVFTYTVTDGSKSDTTTLTITIKGNNDGPTAVADTNFVQAGMVAYGAHQAMDAPLINGNVLMDVAHDNGTADNADIDPDAGDDLDISAVAGDGATTDNGTTFEVVGEFGTLTIDKATGAYSYDLNDTNGTIVALGVGAFETDQFTYTVTDGEKTAQTTLTITIEGNNDGPTAVADMNAVTAGMHNDDPQMDPDPVTGNVIADGSAGDNADTDPDLPNDTLLVTDVDGTEVSDTTNPSGTEIQGTYGLLTISEDGSYSYDLDDGSDAVLGLSDGEMADDVFTYTIEDEGGKSSSTTLTIKVTGNNDGPTAVADTDEVCAGMPGAADQTVTAMFVLDKSGSMDGAPLDLAKAAILDFAANTNVQAVRVVPFDNNATSPTPSVWIDVSTPGGITALTTYLAGVSAGGTTDYRDAITQAQADWAGAPAADLSNIYFLSDGAPSGGDGLGDAPTLVPAWETFLSTNGIDNAYAVGIGAGPSDADLQEVAWPNVPDETNNVFQLTSADDLSDTIVGTITMIPANLTGNVITDAEANGDNGADLDPDLPADTLTVIGVAVGDTGSDVAGNVGVALEGMYGELTIEADGSYTYDLSDLDPDTLGLALGQSDTDVFTYTIEDAGGKMSTTTVTITVKGNNDGPTALADFNMVTEADGDVDVDTNNITGNVITGDGAPNSAGPDTDPDGDDLDVTGITGAGATTDNPTTFEVVGQYGTLTINKETGEYTYDLDDSNPTVDALVDENDTLTDIFNYTVSDGSKSDSADLTITIKGLDDDTVPVAKPDCYEVTEAGGQTANALFVLDKSGSMDNGRLDLAKAAILDFADNPGVLSVRVVPFDSNSGSSPPSSVWFDMNQPGALANLTTYLGTFSPGGGTDYQDAITQAQTDWPGAPNVADVSNIYFISDGAPSSGDELTATDVTNWENFLTTNSIDNAFAIGIGTSQLDGDLQDVGFPNSAPNGNVIIIDSADDLNATFGNTLANTVTGNVLTDDTGAGADMFQDDGPHATMPIASLVVDSVTFTFDGTDVTNGTTNAVTPGSSISILTVLGGTLTFDFSNGDFSYTSPTVDADTDELFSYSIKDGNGDISDPVQFKITVKDVPNEPPAISAAQDIAVSEEGLAGGVADNVGNPTDTTDSAANTGQVTATDPEGGAIAYTLTAPADGLFSSDGDPVNWTGDGTDTLTGSAGGNPVLTIAIDAAGEVTATLIKRIDHPDETSEDVLTVTVGVTATDPVGASDTAMFTVSVEDDSPVFNSVDDTSLDATAGSTVTGNYDADFGGDDLDFMSAALRSSGALGGDPVTFDQTADTPSAGVTQVDVVDDGTTDTLFTFFYTTTTDPVNAAGDGTGELQAFLDPNDPDGSAFFTLTVNPDQTYDFTLHVTGVITQTTVTGDDFGAFGPTGQVATPDQSLILSSDSDDVNASNNGVGVDNPQINAGEDLDMTFAEEQTQISFALAQWGGGSSADVQFSFDGVVFAVNPINIDSPGGGNTATVDVMVVDAGNPLANTSAQNGDTYTIYVTDTFTEVEVVNTSGAHFNVNSINYGAESTIEGLTANFGLTTTDLDGDPSTLVDDLTIEMTPPPVASEEKATISLSFESTEDFANLTNEENGSVLQWDGTTASVLFDEDNFSSGANVDGVHVFTGNGTILGQTYEAGDMLLSTTGSETLPAATGGTISFADEDIVFWDASANGGSGGASILLNLSNSSNVDVDAISVNPANGNLIISLEQDRFGFEDGDLLEYDGSNFTVFFDEDTGFGLGGYTRTTNDIDGAHVLGADEMIFTTNETETINGVTFEDGDLVHIKGNTVTKILEEDNFNGQNNEWDIDAVDPPQAVIDQLLAKAAAQQQARAAQISTVAATTLFLSAGDAFGYELAGNDDGVTVEATADGAQIQLGSALPAAVNSFDLGDFADVSAVGTDGADDLNFSEVAVFQTAGDFVVDGGAGNDAITGSDLSTLNIFGGSGDDLLAGGAADANFLYDAGDNGTDSFVQGEGTTTIMATEDGAEIGVGSNFDNDVDVIDANGFTNVVVHGTEGGDNLNFSDVTMLGDIRIQGRGGDDTIKGSVAGDIIDGGDGNDTLTGGAGVDYLTGGAGADIFKVTETGRANVDRLVDFDINEDHIDLSDIILGSLSDPGDLSEIGRFLSVESDGTDTTIKVNSDGASDFEQAAVIEGVDTNLDQLVLGANLTLV